MRPSSERERKHEELLAKFGVSRRGLAALAALRAGSASVEAE